MKTIKTLAACLLALSVFVVWFCITNSMDYYYYNIFIYGSAVIKVTFRLFHLSSCNTASIDAFAFSFQLTNYLFCIRWLWICFRVGHFVLPLKHPSACGNTSGLSTDALLILLLFMLQVFVVAGFFFFFFFFLSCTFKHVAESTWWCTGCNMDHTADVKNKALHPALTDSAEETWQNQSETNTYIM